MKAKCPRCSLRAGGPDFLKTSFPGGCDRSSTDVGRARIGLLPELPPRLRGRGLWRELLQLACALAPALLHLQGMRGTERGPVTAHGLCAPAHGKALELFIVEMIERGCWGTKHC